MQTKNIIIPLVVVLFLAMALNCVSAAVAVVAPTTGANLTGTFILNCSYTNGSEITNPAIENSSFYWNGTGSWVVFATRSGFACNAATCAVTLRTDDTGILDGRGAINCSLGNDSNARFASGTIGKITIDDTNPSMTLTVDKTKESVGRVIQYSALISDATSGILSQSCNATDPAGTVHDLTIGSSSTLELTRTIQAGTWTLLCSSTDYAGNSNTASQTVTAKVMGEAIDVSDATGSGSDTTNYTWIIIIVAAVALIYFATRK